MPSINSNFDDYNISAIRDDIEDIYNNDLSDVDESFDIFDDYEINSSVHEVNTIQQLQAMGIETNAINPDILEDALLSIVSLPL